VFKRRHARNARAESRGRSRESLETHPNPRLRLARRTTAAVEARLLQTHRARMMMRRRTLTT
jgi:hypothetical protein